MIFYFSGTGNSKHLAEKVGNITGDRLIYINEDLIEERQEYKIEENENIGFIFPVYWYSMPTVVEKFLKNLQIEGYTNQYAFIGVTFGIAAGNVTNRVMDILHDKKIDISGQFGVKMVDNYVIGYDIVDKEKQKKILSNAEKEMDKICLMIQNKERTTYLKKGLIRALTGITGAAYRNANHTKKFAVTHKCNGCTLCAKNCPCNTVEMVDNKPIWSGDCTFCLKCIHNCKQQAIQYGSHTQKRRRYNFEIL